MAINIDNRRRFYGVSFIIGGCAGGSLSGFLRLSVGLLGGDPGMQFLFFTVILLSFWLGLMGPQWMLRLMMKITRRADVSSSPQESHADIRPMWLPGGRVDFHAVSTALAGSVVLWVLFSIMATFSVDGLKWIQRAFASHFFLNLFAMRILDSLLLIIWMLPVWFVAGVVLALLYRFTLSSESGRAVIKPLELEQRLPVLMVLGLVAGYSLWQLVLIDLLPPRTDVWLAKLILLVSVISVIMLPELETRKRKGQKYQTTSIDLNYIPGSSLTGIILVLVCGLLVGGGLYLWGYVVDVIYDSVQIQKGWSSSYFIGLLLGYYLATRNPPETNSSQIRLAVNLLIWAGFSMVATVLMTLLWIKSVRVESLPARQLAAFILLLIVFIKTIILGRVVYVSRNVAQASMMSRTLGWTQWLSWLFLGVIIGRVGCHCFILPRFGSLMVLTALILAALLGGGLTIIYYGRPGMWFRRWLITAGFLLVGINSLVMPWAARYWLRMPQMPMRLVEDVRGAYALVRDETDESLMTVRLNGMFLYRVQDKIAQSRDNRQWINLIGQLPDVEDVLVAGMNEAVWPRHAQKSDRHIDLLLEPALFERLDHHLTRDASDAVTERTINPLGSHWHLWVRRASRHYDLLWLHHQHHQFDSLLAGPAAPWQDMKKCLHRHGIIMVYFGEDIPAIETDLASGSGEIWNVIDLFRFQGGVLYPAASTLNGQAETGLILCFWPDSETWRMFLNAAGYSLQTADTFNRPLSLGPIAGRFVSFSSIRSQ